MTIQRFEDLTVWQMSQDVSVLIYQKFSRSWDFSFRDQIRKASVSISNNIAEGFERNTNPDFKRFLYFALGSNSELRSMLYLAKRLNYLDDRECRELVEKTNEISKMLYGLIKSMK